MQLADLQELTKRLHAKYPVSSGGDWYMINCVRRSAHGGLDRRPSMGVLLDDGKAMAKCHSCGFTGTLQKALFDEAEKDASYLSVAFWLQQLEAQEQANRPLILKPKTVVENILDYTDGWQDLVTATKDFSDKAKALLKAKGVTELTARRVGVCECPKHFSDDYTGELPDGTQREIPYNSLVFPFLIRTLDGHIKCVGAGARPLEQAPYKYTTLYKFKKTHFLYLEPVLQKVNGRPLTVVEGYFDALHINQEKIASVSITGTVLSERQATKIQLARPSHVYLLLDPDSPGEIGAENAKERLDKLKVPTTIVRLESDPKYYSQNSLRHLLRVAK